jgi:hypothetical protein
MDEHVITADDVEYINDATLDDDFDTWMGVLDYYYKNGKIT